MQPDLCLCWLFLAICSTFWFSTCCADDYDRKNGVEGGISRRINKHRCLEHLDKAQLRRAYSACHSFIHEPRRVKMADIECFIKCFMENLKLTDYHGTPQKMAVQKFLIGDEGETNEKKVDYVKQVVSNCFGKPIRHVDPYSTECQGYIEFFMCVFSNKMVQCPKDVNK